MEKRSEKIRQYILEKISAHPKDIVAVTAKQFSVTRMTVHRHLGQLLKNGKIIKTGNTKNTTYQLAGEKNKTLYFKIDENLEEHAIWQKYLQSDFAELPDNVKKICDYGFMEIFNNALEHSEGKKVEIRTKWEQDSIDIYIADDGIGIFKKIKDFFNYADERESILQLSKGKLTTKQVNHSGEGIFFTSRVFDIFTISANGLSYIKHNIGDDWFIKSKEGKDVGTTVKMEININTIQRLEKVYEDFSNTETQAFDKTQIIVQLSKLEEESYISRSQAKRVLMGIDKFKHVVLDFKNVKTVGQGFVDEVFRVFKNKYPGIQIEYTNANEDVKFMLERGIATAEM